MSRIFEKSKSNKYSKYFTSIDELSKSFSKYSIKFCSPVLQENVVFRPWDTGKVGIPLYCNCESKIINVDHTDTHTLVVGPTGSKKSRLIVMPLVRILGSSGESMIISDPKAEVYNRTAGYLREQGYNIFVLNLRSPMYGHRWNPLSIPFDFFSKGEIDKSYEFVNDIAENLIQSDKSDKDPFWDNSAGSFFFGIVLLLFKYCKERGIGKEYIHIGNVIRMRNMLFSGANGNKNIHLWNYAKQDPIIASSLIGTVETANDTKAGILSVFDQKIRMFSIQPNLLDMLSANDIEMDTIGQAPTVIYLVVPDEKTGYHGLVSLFIKQSYEYMIYNAQIDTERDGFHVSMLKNRVNYVLNEFSSLPTIRDFPAMVTAARSRNIRFTLVIQSKHQLLQRYGDETETIQTNCNNWIFLTSRELQFLEELSSLCGKTIEDNPQPILSVSDLQRLDKDNGEALLICGRAKPCITKLADIELYDNNQYEKASVAIRQQQIPPELEIVIPLTNQDQLFQNDFKSNVILKGSQEFTAYNDINRLLQHIESRINEIESKTKFESTQILKEKQADERKEPK